MSTPTMTAGILSLFAPAPAFRFVGEAHDTARVTIGKLMGDLVSAVCACFDASFGNSKGPPRDTISDLRTRLRGVALPRFLMPQPVT